MIFDIEANGLKPTKIHCLSYARNSGDMVTTLTNYNDMRKFLLSQKTLIGHKIIEFDIPVLERILGIKVKANLIDTLALSWYLYEKRLIHGLDSWGKELGVDKPPIKDWENLPLATYINRCQEDVKINCLLWEKEQRYLQKIYDNEKQIKRLIGYLSFKMDCAKKQQESKWLLDEDKVKTRLTNWTELEETIKKKLSLCMPKIQNKVVKSKPNKPFKKDGTPSVAGVKWQALLKEKGLPKDYDGEIEYVVSEDVGNPGSHAQLKDWLYDLGWVPQTYKYNRNKETNEFKKVAQISLPLGQGICPSIKDLYSKEPSLELLDGLSILSHRISIMSGFLKNVDENGYLPAEVQGLTNTLRFKHTVIVNLPGVDKAYGKDIRECLIAPEGYELCGSDQSSLEERTKHHYMYPYDPEYVKDMNTEGFDPHLDIALLANMMTSKQVYDYKAGDKSMSSVRHDAKQVNYSCTYGVTPKGIVRNTGMDLNNAEKLHKTYWKRNWAIKAIEDAVKVKTVDGNKWLFNPVSGLYYSLRYDKDKFSTLNQGTGTYCFDRWVYYILEKRPQLTAQFHDEVVLCVKNGSRDKATALLKWCVGKVNKELKLNRDLDVDVQFGNNYSEIH